MNKEELRCPICEKPTRVYMGNARKDRLCGEHADMFKRNEIIQCEFCARWNKVDSLCECRNLEISKNEEFLEEENKVIVINKDNKSRCITCGKSTDGLLFCGSCYHKYKDKELLFKISNCSTVELLDESYEGIYTCKDGHVVKSKSERDIDNYLYENNIQHAYEKELAYGASSKEVIKPDFYLPNFLGPGLDVYIEHWGYNENNLHYKKSKKFKMEHYEKLCKNEQLTLVCTNEKEDAKDMDASLRRKLNKLYIKRNEINL